MVVHTVGHGRGVAKTPHFGGRCKRCALDLGILAKAMDVDRRKLLGYVHGTFRALLCLSVDLIGALSGLTTYLYSVVQS